MSIEVHDTHDALYARATELIVDAARRGPVALSGGSTPEPVYRRVAASGASGSWYQVDERYVPLGHPDSNASMIIAAGLTGLHPVPTELPVEEAAAAYAKVCREAWQGAPFAMALLGIGDDGHTASLFPGSPELDVDCSWLLDDACAWIVATRDEHRGHRRVTMTFPLLNAVPCVFLVTGRGKAAVVSRAVSGGDVPAGRILDPLWLLDDDAASALVV